MLALSLKIVAWVFLWIVVWIIFSNYLPTHAHFEYMGLVSPFVLITLLLSALFYGSGITADAYTVIVIPGLLFWSVIVLLIYVHRKQKAQKAKT